MCGFSLVCFLFGVCYNLISDISFVLVDQCMVGVVHREQREHFRYRNRTVFQPVTEVLKNNIRNMTMDIDSILPIVTSFFEGMTSEQWNLSKSSVPDVDTITILGETLLEIVILMTQSILKGLKSTAVAVSEKSVIRSLGNTLPQVFALALDVPEVNLVSSEYLTQLTAKEIAECVNSVLSMGVDRVKATTPRVTPPKILQGMITQAGKMIKELMRNRKLMCAPSKSGKKVYQQLVNSCQSSSSSGKTISEDRESLLSATSSTVQEIIQEEVSQYTESTDDYDYDQLESGSTLEIKNAADDIAEVILDEIMSLNEYDLETAQSTPSLKKVSKRIKTCAAKQIALASICRFVGRLNNKYFDSQYNPGFDRVLSRQSMQSVMGDIDALLPTAVGEIKQGQTGSQWMDDIVSGGTLKLTNELNNILNNHIDRMKPKMTSRPKALQSKCKLVCPPRAIISADILASVWCFLGVMRWWLHTQSETLTARVITHILEKAVSEGLIGGASLPSAPGKGSGSERNVTTPEFTEEYSDEQERTVDRRKLSIRIIVLKLVTRIFVKANMWNTLGSPDTIIKRLCENIWVEIKDEDFGITQKMMKHIDKTVFKKICKQWHSVASVLVELEMENPELDKFIASSFKDQLVSHQQKSSPISRFFPSLCTALIS